MISPADRKRLAAILGMLGSNSAGERDNAARLAERFRRQHDLTWDELLAASKEAAPPRPASAAPETPPPQRPPPPPPKPAPAPPPQYDAPRPPPPRSKPPPPPSAPEPGPPAWRPSPTADSKYDYGLALALVIFVGIPVCIGVMTFAGPELGAALITLAGFALAIYCIWNYRRLTA